MRLEAQGYRVIVELLPYDNYDLVLTDTYREVQQKAKVVDVGAGRRCKGGNVIMPDLNLGDIVLITQTGGTLVQYGGKKYQIVEPENIICKVEK